MFLAQSWFRTLKLSLAAAAYSVKRKKDAFYYKVSGILLQYTKELLLRVNKHCCSLILYACLAICTFELTVLCHSLKNPLLQNLLKLVWWYAWVTLLQLAVDDGRHTLADAWEVARVFSWGFIICIICRRVWFACLLWGFSHSVFWAVCAATKSSDTKKKNETACIRQWYTLKLKISLTWSLFSENNLQLYY